MKARSTSDGRIGWPSIVVYELIEGPDKGKRVVCPPTFVSHPHPDPEGLRLAGKAHFMASCAYRQVILDGEEYQKLKDGGHLGDPMHRGESTINDGRTTA